MGFFFGLFAARVYLQDAFFFILNISLLFALSLDFVCVCSWIWFWGPNFCTFFCTITERYFLPQHWNWLTPTLPLAHAHTCTHTLTHTLADRQDRQTEFSTREARALGPDVPLGVFVQNCGLGSLRTRVRTPMAGHAAPSPPLLFAFRGRRRDGASTSASLPTGTQLR